MAKPYTFAEIDLSGALVQNISVLRSRLRPDCRFMAVVKSDAYGHGIVDVSKAAEKAGAEYLAVARPEEGAQLREAGIFTPILVMGAILDVEATMVVQNGLAQAVFSRETCSALQSEAVRLDKQCVVHIKVDTGMNRVGLRTMDEFMRLLAHIDDACPNLKAEAVMTHFSASEAEDKSFTLGQLEAFAPYAAKARERGLLLHCANSGAALDLTDEAQFDMIRCGIAMYGYHPDTNCGIWADLKPVLSLKTAVVQVKDVPEGCSVSYGRKYFTNRLTRVATIPVGYGDGYKRLLSGKAEVLVRGKRAPIIGTICMDQCMVDVTDVQNVAVGDEVVLIGDQGSESVTADELAALTDTIPYEILLSITKRVARVYV